MIKHRLAKEITSINMMKKASMLVALSPLFAPMANAVSITSNFTVTASDVTIQEAFFNASSNGWASAGTAGANSYDYVAINFTADSSGSYTFGQSSAPVDTAMAVYYNGSFDTDALIDPNAYNDDSSNGYTCGSLGRCPEITANLVAGQTNTLIISTYSPSLNLSLPLGFFSNGVGNISFVVYVPETYALEDAQPSLEKISNSVNAVNRSTSLMVNGAHSRPMSHRVEEGEKVMWVAGDWGEDNHGERNGDSGLAEFNVGYNYGFAQFNLTMGKTWASQDLDTDGSLDADSTYVMVESIIPVPEIQNLYATLGGYYAAGEAEIIRGYDVSGTQNYSEGTPDTHTWGIRARLDWENLKTLSTTRISPYVDLSFSQMTVDGYTETGGDQPAQFDKSVEDVTEIRLGTNTATPVSTNFDFIALAEGVHRFNGEGQNITGSMVNIDADFNIAGEDYEQTWLRAGIGAEGNLGRKGKVTVMLNATTEGSASNAWLAASYQMKF